jgi:cell division transport system permease protein
VRAIKYFFVEAGASLWRRRRAAMVAILTIAAGLFVLGFFLVLNTNLQRLVGRWSESAELSVYVKDEVTPDQLKVIDDVIVQSPLVSEKVYLTKEQAAARFREDFPDMASAAGALDSNPFPASFEVQLKPEVREAGQAVDTLASTLSVVPGVADVRYDRRWLSRLNALVRFVRGIGIVIIAMLAVASALTVANVVRLAASARRDEIHIMQLVGAPFAYVRGPFIVEGILQGGAGALVAVLLLWGLFMAVRLQYGQMMTDVLGGTSLTFLSPAFWVVIVGGGMLLGCVGGMIVARQVR